MFQTSDWKTEKHVPVIEIVEQKENKIKVRVTVGKKYRIQTQKNII